MIRSDTINSVQDRGKIINSQTDGRSSRQDDLSLTGFNSFIAKVESKKIPLWTHLDLTYRCNASCIHCCCRNLPDEWNGPELTTEEVYKLLDQLAEIGSLYLTLSGGEVLLRPDFFQIGHYAQRAHFSLSIFTNGLLIDNQITDRLGELSPLSVEISIYGADSTVHDAITQRPGSFRNVLHSVALLKKRGIRVVLKTTLMKPNFHQAREIELLAQELGCDWQYALEISPKNNRDRSIQKYQLDEVSQGELVQRQLTNNRQEIPEQTAREKPLCGAGSIGCYIAPNGNVYPCSLLLHPMGNIKDKCFREIWYGHSEIREELLQLNTYADISECRRCSYVKTCQRCNGMAELETGDMKKCYPRLNYLARMHYETILNKL